MHTYMQKELRAGMACQSKCCEIEEPAELFPCDIADDFGEEDTPLLPTEISNAQFSRYEPYEFIASYSLKIKYHSHCKCLFMI